VFGDNKPNCIILDEIDGIDGRNSIDALIGIIKAPLRSSVKKTKNSKNTTQMALIRPLICICNDHYAPALRELRKLAQVFVFQPPSEIRLVQRLKTVCSLEGLFVTGTLTLNHCIPLTIIPQSPYPLQLNLYPIPSSLLY
jgi:chromosome transmission fidelity protein 18